MWRGGGGGEFYLRCMIGIPNRSRVTTRMIFQELILVWIAILSEANDWLIFLRGEQRRKLI